MANDAHDNAQTDREALARFTKEEKPKRRRTNRPKLCTHGYPAIPDPRGCIACWKRHPGYVKPKVVARQPIPFPTSVSCEKCFMPSQTGFPPLRRVVGSKPATYEHATCPPNTNAEPAPARRAMRALRRMLRASLRRHIRKMLNIHRQRQEQALILRMAERRLARAVIAAAEEHERDQAHAG